MTRTRVIAPPETIAERRRRIRTVIESAQDIAGASSTGGALARERAVWRRAHRLRDEIMNPLSHPFRLVGSTIIRFFTGIAK